MLTGLGVRSPGTSGVRSVNVDRASVPFMSMRNSLPACSVRSRDVATAITW